MPHEKTTQTDRYRNQEREGQGGTGALAQNIIPFDAVWPVLSSVVSPPERQHHDEGAGDFSVDQTGGPVSGAPMFMRAARCPASATSRHAKISANGMLEKNSTTTE